MEISINNLKKIVSNSQRKIRVVFPEGENKYIQKAVEKIVNKDKNILPILIMKSRNQAPLFIKKHEKLNRIKFFFISEMDIKKYANFLYELRKQKGLSKEEATTLVKQSNYIGALMIKMKEADGEVCGINYTTADTLRPALQIVKTSPNYPLVTSAFIMMGQKESFIFADCAININPDATMLAKIGLAISNFANKVLEMKTVRTTFLSYSSMGSGKGEMADKVREAVKIAQKENQNKRIQIYGELQFDAAYDERIRNKKAKNIGLTAAPHVYIFPTLESGNIAYKIVERIANYKAIGAILIGIAAPINDLSRGASVTDIINLTYITVAQALKIS